MRGVRLITTVLAVVAALPSPVRGDDLDPAKVRESIERAASYLKKRQTGNGSWPYYENVYDTTPLCTLALLQAGVPVDDPAIQSALKYLRNPSRELKLTYIVALDTMVLCAAEPKKDMLLIRRNAKWLEDVQIKAGAMRGGWSYPHRSSGGDNSNSQFALLALHEAQRAGVPVREETWQMAMEYWRNGQESDGSWGYTPGNGRGTGSMTCAGISAMVITTGRLNQGDASGEGGRILCCGAQQDNQPVERGLAWLARNFSVDTNPGGPNNRLLYYLYGLERAGRLTARRFIGQHDWYREGTDSLLSTQDTVEGLWKGAGNDESLEHIATSMALLFLAKGRRPVLLGKLQHGEGDDWNHHRSDAANLTAYVETRWKRDLSWQTIDTAGATSDDLLQAPVLYLSGEIAPRFDPDQIRAMREYLQRGGFIMAEACCNDGQQFDAGFRELMRQVFPEPEYGLRLLEPDHPIWYAEEKVDPSRTRPLWGINFGCRTSVVYAPPDPENASRPALSCLWELASPDRQAKHADKVQAEVDAALSIGINILAYATNREVKYKYDLFRQDKQDQQADPHDRGLLQIAKLKHSGGWNIAPGALLALQETMIREQQVRVNTEPREVSLDDDTLFNYHLLFMHGRNDFRLTQAERDRLRTYVERGGMLLADAVCASEAFAKAFRREMAVIFPDKAWDRIPAEHPLFSNKYGGFDLKTVTRREPGRAADGSLRSTLRQVEPFLEGLQLDQHRLGVIFSPYDLSCALESHDGVECRGYTRDDAARLGLNVIVYSLQE